MNKMNRKNKRVLKNKTYNIKKMKMYSGKKIHSTLTLMLIIAVAVVGYLWHFGKEIPQFERRADTSVNGIMEVHYIDVGQGDCTFIKCGNAAMLIDAGDNYKGTQVQLYLKKQRITKLDYVIATHPDSDHIGGLDVIVYKYDCDTIIMPDIDKDSNSYRDLVAAMNSKSYKAIFPEIGEEYPLGEAVFTIISPVKQYEDSNNSSVGILLKHGENKFLFTGDAEAEAEKDMVKGSINIDCDVYKVGHHGSANASSEIFLNAINPSYAVISCGNDNSYGHPHSTVLNELKYREIKIFRTDKQGTIIATSDGISIKWNCEPTE